MNDDHDVTWHKSVARELTMPKWINQDSLSCTTETEMQKLITGCEIQWTQKRRRGRLQRFEATKKQKPWVSKINEQTNDIQRDWKGVDS